MYESRLRTPDVTCAYHESGTYHGSVNVQPAFADGPVNFMVKPLRLYTMPSYHRKRFFLTP